MSRGKVKIFRSLAAFCFEHFEIEKLASGVEAKEDIGRQKPPLGGLHGRHIMEKVKKYLKK